MCAQAQEHAPGLILTLAGCSLGLPVLISISGGCLNWLCHRYPGRSRTEARPSLRCICVPDLTSTSLSGEDGIKVSWTRSSRKKESEMGQHNYNIR